MKTLKRSLLSSFRDRDSRMNFSCTPIYIIHSFKQFLHCKKIVKQIIYLIIYIGCSGFRNGYLLIRMANGYKKCFMQKMESLFFASLVNLLVLYEQPLRNYFENTDLVRHFCNTEVRVYSSQSRIFQFLLEHQTLQHIQTLLLLDFLQSKVLVCLY